MTRNFVPIIVLSVLFGACSTLSTSNTGPEIRVTNRSQSDFTSVRVVFPSQEVEYGALPAGGSSEYRPIEEAYRYAFIEVMVGEQRLVLQPIDYVGEGLLGPGRYTYALDTAAGGEQLTLELEEE